MSLLSGPTRRTTDNLCSHHNYFYQPLQKLTANGETRGRATGSIEDQRTNESERLMVANF